MIQLEESEKCVFGWWQMMEVLLFHYPDLQPVLTEGQSRYEKNGFSNFLVKWIWSRPVYQRDSFWKLHFSLRWNEWHEGSFVELRPCALTAGWKSKSIKSNNVCIYSRYSKQFGLIKYHRTSNSMYHKYLKTSNLNYEYSVYITLVNAI